MPPRGAIMTKTNIKVISSGKTIEELIKTTIEQLKHNGYKFLAIALAQQTEFYRTDAERLELVKEYVTLI
jgi:hypothetical protein